ALTEDLRRTLIRLIDAKSVTPDYPFEANWTDVALAPAAQVVRALLEARVAEIADYEGSEMYTFILDAVNGADRAKALDVLAEEASRLGGEEARLLSTAVRMRRACWLARPSRRSWTASAGRRLRRSMSAATLPARSPSASWSVGS